MELPNEENNQVEETQEVAEQPQEQDENQSIIDRIGQQVG